MANHRAEKPSASRRRSTGSKGRATRTQPTAAKGRATRTQPTAAKDRAARTQATAARSTGPVPLVAAPPTEILPVTAPLTEILPVTAPPTDTVYPGPAPRGSEPAGPRRAPRSAEPTGPRPRTAEKVSRGTPPRTAATGGKRKAVKPSRSTGRKNPISSLPSPPTLVGAAAIALAAVGAVTISGSGSGFTSGGFQKAAAQASVLNGASSIGSSDALSGRLRAVSRDSERQALQDAADQKLQAAAEAQAKQRNAALAALAASAEKHATAIAKNAWQLPIPLGVYHLTARFGQCSGLWSHCHTGLDFAAPAGTPIQAIAAGVVTDVGWAGAYGNRTVITLSDGTELWYAHQTSYNVSVGEKISAGQVIGSVGATGNVTGPHLHVEVRPGAGDPVDPYAAFIAHGINPG